MGSHKFFTLDVFTSRRLAGNPLAVVLAADDLDTARMQAIAGEFNLSETVFVRAPSRPSARAAVRIFTPVYEMPFAGHPLIGTASLLALMGADTSFVLEIPIGDVACTAQRQSEDQASARFALPKRAQALPGCPESAAIAGALGLAPEEIGWGGYKPGRFDAGALCDCIPLRDLAALAKALPQRPAFDQLFPAPAGLVYLYTSTAENGTHWRTRMFAPGYGVPEDPATGGAAAAFTGALMAYGAFRDGLHAISIQQGVEMGRPSLLGLDLSIQDGVLQQAHLYGEAVVMSEGLLRI